MVKLTLLPGGRQDNENHDDTVYRIFNLIQNAERSILSAGLGALLTTQDMDAVKNVLSQHGVDPDSTLGQAFLLFIQYEADTIEEDPEDDPPRPA